jgi:hypothetical protein
MRLFQEINRLFELSLPDELDAPAVQLNRIGGPGRRREEAGKKNSCEPERQETGAHPEKKRK